MSRIFHPVASATPDVTAISLRARLRPLVHALIYLTLIVAAAASLTLSVEAILRGSPGEAFGFFVDACMRHGGLGGRICRIDRIFR